MGKSLSISVHVAKALVIVYPSRARDNSKGHSWNLVARDDLSGLYTSWCQSGAWQRLGRIDDQVFIGFWSCIFRKIKVCHAIVAGVPSGVIHQDSRSRFKLRHTAARRVVRILHLDRERIHFVVCATQLAILLHQI
jgi:hypothetical protein